MDIAEVAAAAVEVDNVHLVAPPVIDTILTWIGFDQQATRDSIREEGFGNFTDLMSTKEKDISTLADSYGRRTVADGRVIFGLRRIKHLIGLLHWVQDFRRVGREPTIEGFDNAAQFREALEVAFDRADVRKIEGDQSDTLSKAADPGKLKDERKWTEWEPAFVNYLSTIPGVTGVPLSYVIRELETPTPGEDYGNFNERSIACVALTGTIFQADARKVHQLVKSFLQAETAEQWVRPHIKAQNGRLDMKALRDHYTGEGNTSRRIAVAERLRESLHYKNEKSMQFSSFLAKMQSMFNIFEEENEIMSEQAKVRILLKKVEHPELRSAVNALRIRATMDGLTFTECANHLSGMVAELPDYQSARKVSATDSKSFAAKRIRGGGADYNKNKGDPGSKRKGINMPDGSIWTGYYSDWDKMSDSDKQIVMDTRKKNKAKGLTPGKKKGGGNDLKVQFAEMKRTLAAMQSKKLSNKDADDDADDSDIAENAGDAFGGRRSKKQKKE